MYSIDVLLGFKDLDEELRLNRTAVRIYFHLVKKREPMGVRDIARELKLSPSTVYYNLKRLEELGLIRKEGAGYTVRKFLKPDEIVVVKGLFIHRLTICSFFFLGTTLGFITVSIMNGFDIDRILAIITSLTAFILLFLEGLKQTKKYA